MAVRKPPAARDKLRSKLDLLAEKIVDRVMGDDAKVTVRQQVDALKITSAYWALSRKGQGEKAPDNAWTGYAQSIFANGKDTDAAAHDA